MKDGYLVVETVSRAAFLLGLFQGKLLTVSQRKRIKPQTAAISSVTRKADGENQENSEESFEWCVALLASSVQLIV